MQAQAQTGRLFRFTLKKEWLKILLWLIGAAFYVILGIFAFVEVYGDPSEREAMAIAMENPAMQALFGRLIGADDYTIGAMYSQTMSLIGYVIFAIMSILLVVRNTRSEEEDGILELIQALPTGRLAHTTSAIFILLLSNALLAVVSASVLLALGDRSITLEGAVLTGLSYATIGLIFGAVTLVTAQLSNNARGAMMLAFGVLGISYMMRIVGDSGYELLSWLSPLGLIYGTEAFVSNNWFPIWIGLALSLALIVTALWLKNRRDMGAGLLPDRAGKKHASSFLKTLFGFTFKLLKTPLIVWAVAMLLLGVSYGSVIGDVEGMLEGNEVVAQIIATDPSLNLTDQFIGVILGVLAMAATIPSLQVMLKLRGEEKKHRMEKVIASAHSRLTVFSTFILLSTLVALVFQLLQSLAFGGSAVAVGYDVSLTDIITAGLGYVPAILLMIGVAAILIGWFPKLTSLIWLYHFFVFVVFYFGGLFDIPEVINGLSPFYHIPEQPIESWNWTVTLVLTALALLFMAIGSIGYRKRDID
ncbi:ABC transporter permease [Alkalibacterium sp.]|nr:MAG: ABC transporter permease [Alkalibacterium sp.]